MKKLIFYFFLCVEFCLNKFCYSQNQQENFYSPHLVRDEYGRWLNPTLIPDNFLDDTKKKYYQIRLSEILNIPISNLDYSLKSIKIIQKKFVDDKSNVKQMFHNGMIYLPLFHYMVQVIIKHHPNCKIYIVKGDEIISDFENGYPNVYINFVYISYFDKKYEKDLFRYIEKRLLRGYYEEFETIVLGYINYKYNPNKIFSDYSTGEFYPKD